MMMVLKLLITLLWMTDVFKQQSYAATTTVTKNHNGIIPYGAYSFCKQYYPNHFVLPIANPFLLCPDV